jgi:deoxyadenosine/deoxycytidine kinase
MHSDELAPYMRELIENLEPSQLSEVKELPIGCTMVQLVERREFRPVSFEEAEEKLRGELYEKKLMVEYRDWMEQLRSHTFIERRGYFADAAQFIPDTPHATDFEAGMSGAGVLGSSPTEGEDAQ